MSVFISVAAKTGIDACIYERSLDGKFGMVNLLSRNIKPTIIEKPIYLRDLTIEKSDNLVCLTTENVDSVSLKEYLSSCEINKPFVIAIGPEKGWSSKDIEILKEKGFKFIRLSGNILRTETSSLVIGSIVKYLKGEI